MSEETSQEPVVRVVGLEKKFPVRTGLFGAFAGRELFVHAVDGVSFHIDKGKVFGLAGESGSGKTTTGRLLLRLIEPTSGSIYFQGKNITDLTDREMKPLRKEIQVVFQDPFESLDPRMLVKDIVAEPLRVQRVAASDEELLERVKAALADVDLVPPEEFLYRFPHELSGGQRQRVAIARTFVLNPSFVVADEPVSMLDVSIRAEILNLMLSLVQKFGASFLYITHDLALARHICDELGIMYLGKMMEMGPVEKVVNEPMHPYTRALLDAVPVPDPAIKRTRDVISGEIPSPTAPPPGCRFHTRCPYAHERCKIEEPMFTEVERDHFVACHLYT